jgi:hypothetical protein
MTEHRHIGVGKSEANSSPGLLAKGILAWVLLTAAIFTATTVVSYFFLSDGYGLPNVSDGITRIGFPFTFIERGGIVGQEVKSPSSLVGDLLLSSLLALIAIVIYYTTARKNDANATR